MSADDIPHHCNTCRRVTLFRQAPDGKAYCVPCMSRPASGTPRDEAGRFVAAPRSSANQIIKLAGTILSLIFLVSLGTCVYICGSAAKAAKKAENTYVPPSVGVPDPVAQTKPAAESPADVRRKSLAAINGILVSRGSTALALSLDNTFVIDPLDKTCTKRDLTKLVESMRETLLGAGFVDAKCVEWSDERIPIAAPTKKRKPAPVDDTIAPPYVPNNRPSGELADPFGGQ